MVQLGAIECDGGNPGEMLIDHFGTSVYVMVIKRECCRTDFGASGCFGGSPFFSWSRTEALVLVPEYSNG